MAEKTDRNSAVVNLFRSGVTMADVARKFGICKVRVSQILKTRGISRQHGGASLRSARRSIKVEESLAVARDEWCLRAYGCSHDEYVKFLAASRRARDLGVAWFRTPLGAYRMQKVNARSRGIPWHLSLDQWWDVWTRSGKWGNRGRGRKGYVMGRFDTAGAYALGNVLIAESTRIAGRRPKHACLTEMEKK